MIQIHRRTYCPDDRSGNAETLPAVEAHVQPLGFVLKCLHLAVPASIVSRSFFLSGELLIGQLSETVVVVGNAPSDFDRVIDQPADLKSNTDTALIASSHRTTTATMYSIHSLLSENHP
jgi:hypothetical protein